MTPLQWAQNEIANGNFGVTGFTWPTWSQPVVAALLQYMQLVGSAYAAVQQQLVDLITNQFGPEIGQIFGQYVQNAYDLMIHTLQSVQDQGPSTFAGINSQNVFFTGPNAGQDPAGPPPAPYNGDNSELKL